MSARPIYDTIGVDYANLRRPDRRIAAQIEAALGPSQTVLNVGAGTGSYEPEGRDVTALEPSAEMIAQRRPNAAPVVQGQAEDLPFLDGSFDAVMAVLTVHHWNDLEAGLLEMKRVARDRVVIVTFDPDCRAAWLLDYLPALAELDAQQMPPMSVYPQYLGAAEVVPIPIPHDCTDGFLYAYWRRPEAYLDPRIRSGSSSFWKLSGLEQGLGRLREDIENGAWHRRYADVAKLTEYDAGYRLVVSSLRPDSR